MCDYRDSAGVKPKFHHRRHPLHSAPMRVTIADDPFSHHYQGKSLWTRNAWPAKWVSHPDPGPAPFVAAYRRHFKLAAPATVRLHVCADERYHLWLDGTLLGRGPERGDADHWFYETYELPLAPGRHTLVARVWSLGQGERAQMAGEGGGGAGGQVAAPYAQLSVYHGLLVACDDEFLPLIATGVAEWEARLLPGYAFSPPGIAWGTGARITIDGTQFPWNFHRGDGEGWLPVVTRHAAVTEGRMEAGPSHVMRPAPLPPMLDRYVRPGKVRFVEAVATTPSMRRTTTDGSSGSEVPSTPAPADPANNLHDEERDIQRSLSNRQPLRFAPYIARRIILDLENY